MRLTQIDTFLIRILYLFAAGIVISTVLGYNAVSSAFFGLTFVLIVLLWLAGSLRKVTLSDAILFLIIGLALGNIIISAAIDESPISFAYLKKYIMFISTLVFFQSAYKLRIDSNTEQYLLFLNSVIALFFVAVFVLNPPTLYMIRGRISNYLTFGFTNPNLTALFLMCTYTGELIQLFRNKNLFGKLLHLLLMSAVGFFIWETGSRNCLLTLVLVTGLCCILYLTKNGFRLPRWFSFVIAIWPLLFVAAYFTFVDSSKIQEMFSFLVEEGKGLDARLSVWLPALQIYAKFPLWGAYSQISRGTGMSQMHNTHLDILASYGAPVLILVCCLLYGMLRGDNTGNTKKETMARICFSGTIIMGMGEAALFSGGLGIYLFAGMFLLLCNREQEPEKSIGEAGL